MPEDPPENDDDEWMPPLSPKLAARKMKGRDLELGPPGEGMTEAHKERAEETLDVGATLKKRAPKLVDVLADIVENVGVDPAVRGNIGLGLVKLAVPTEAPKEREGSALDRVVDLLTKKR
jgi:hypothetical protein